jgi:hypothetical protein
MRGIGGKTGRNQKLNPMATKTASITLAEIGVKLDHVADHLQKIERRMDDRDRSFESISKDHALLDQFVHGEGGINDQVKKQWRRLDWQYKAIWGLVVANSVQAVYILGAKALGIIKLIP